MSRNAVINYFVPKKYANDKELDRKSRFIVWFVFIVVPIGLLFGILSSIQTPDDKTVLIMSLTFIPLFLLALLHFRKYGSFIFTTHLICGIFFLAMCVMPGTSGGIFSPDMPTLYILPIFALIMGNYRIGIFYALLTVGVFFVYFYMAMQDAGPDLKQLSTISTDYFFLNLVLNFLVILFLVFRNENIRLKLVSELKETNLIISEKSREITDSINYARRIQTAILPERITLKKHLPGLFILYLPKDIVSGDFYWMTEKDGFQLLAVADCTGHGVPGALMSVIGVSQLNDIVMEKGIMHPSQILEELNKNVNRILKQNQGEISDGMDIAVLKINLKDKSLEYAGANRSLYYVRNDELSEIKPTKLPIGGYDFGQEKKFGTSRLQLQAGDMVYLSTDGYADQFGSEKNKKITTKNFKRLLTSIAKLELPDQEKHLLDFFNTFKTGYEQTDDVLVAGLRF